MRRVAKAGHERRNAADRQYDQAARSVLSIAGALFSTVGLVLAVGGYMSINGSAFHILIGLGLIVSGALVSRQHPAGALTYMLVFAGTAAWSLRNLEVGAPLALRLIGPSLLLLMIAVLMPLLFRWRPRHAVVAFTLLIAATAAIGILSLPNGPLAGDTAALTEFLDAQTKGVLQ